jgi:hypothetical protein
MSTQSVIISGTAAEHRISCKTVVLNSILGDTGVFTRSPEKKHKQQVDYLCYEPQTLKVKLRHRSDGSIHPLIRYLRRVLVGLPRPFATARASIHINLSCLPLSLCLFSSLPALRALPVFIHESSFRLLVAVGDRRRADFGFYYSISRYDNLFQ